MSYASLLQTVLLKTCYIHCLEILKFRYLELEQNYAIYHIAKLGVADYQDKKNTVQRLGIQM